MDIDVAKIRPTAGFVLLKRIPEPDRTEGGIYKPEERKRDPQPERALVVKLGPMRAEDGSVPASYGEGATVLIPFYRGSAEMRIGGECYLLVEQTMPIAVLDE